PNAAFSNGLFITDSSFQIKDDLSAWSVYDFEILKQAKDNSIVATNPGQFYQHVRVTNSTGSTQAVTVNASWPRNASPLLSFVTQGATPIHCYQELSGSSSWSEVTCANLVINATAGTA